MKKCRRCSKPAVLHITEIRDAQAVAIHLCETCARDYLDSPEEPTAAPSASGLAAKLEEFANETSDSAAASLICPSCGITFAEFRESGRFGCPNDYTEFRNELMPLLENIHEETKHIGKRPKSRQVATEDQSRMILLRSQQQEAIEREDYETAARLRDEIASLEGALQPKPKAKTTRRSPRKPKTEEP